MNRYKFRGWDDRNKRMISWGELLNSKELLQSFFGNEHYATNPPRYFYERMQFIGICDITGKEIYEGDIIEIEGYNGQLIITSFTCNLLSGLTFNNSNLTFDMGLYDWTPNLSECTVVGNIYQNIELLQNGSNKEND